MFLHALFGEIFELIVAARIPRDRSTSTQRHWWRYRKSLAMGYDDMQPLALTRGNRWLAMLDSCEVKSLKGITVREEIENSYVGHIVNLITLAPDIVATILDEAQLNHITLLNLAVDPPMLWEKQ